mgnify:CR=1 FL=1|tara:strand:+ start:24 stop:1046 length:1023 start_codon:yes stop_codon:yes gene_type:complete
MKKKYLILTVFAIVFTACETDFDVNASWEEVTVVYGLLDEAKELQQVKISKAFLGEMDALQMAQYADSINFGADDLDVKIIRVKSNGDTDTITLFEVLTIRKEGDFHDSIMIYSFDNDNEFLKSKNATYDLLIENKVTGNKVSAKTKVITNFDWYNFDPKYDIGFYKNDLSDFHFKTISWNSVPEGSIYQLNVVFNYSEENLQTSEIIYKSVNWLQGIESFSSRGMSVKLDGEDFFNYLRLHIDQDNDVRRKYESLYLEMTVGSEELETYVTINKPVTGLVQERPQYTNINNGIGLFSTRYTHSDRIGREFDSDLRGLNSATHFYINNMLARNFVYPFDF